MKSLLLLAALLLTTAAIGPSELSPPPIVKSPSIVSASVVALATTGWGKIVWHFPTGGGRAPDSSVTALFEVPNAATAISPSARIGQHWLAASKVRDSFNLTLPAPGASRYFYLCVQGQGKVRSDTTKSVCWPSVLVLTTPNPMTPPVVDSASTDTVVIALRFMPQPSHPIALASGIAQTICVIEVMAGGQAGYRGPRTPLCDTEAARLGPRLKTSQQAYVDSRCVDVAITTPGDGTLTITPLAPCTGVYSFKATSP